MADFSHLSALAVKSEKTADYTFYNIPGEPTIRCRHAGEANKPYYNEVLRRAEHVMRRKAKLNVEMIRDQRDRDRALFPKYICIIWPKAPLDKHGAEAPYSLENCEAFLRALPDHEFDQFRDWAKDASNFVDNIDTGGVAGNSPTV